MFWREPSLSAGLGIPGLDRSLRHIVVLSRGTGTRIPAPRRLLHPGNPDKDLEEKAARKIHAYRELYRDHRCQLDFLSAIDSTSGRIHCGLLRLLFLHAHRETTRFFEILDDEHAQPHTPRFTYRRAAFALFFNTLKGKAVSRSHSSEGCGAPDEHQHRRP